MVTAGGGTLVPREGVPQADRYEIDRFLMLMHGYKELKGNDHRDAFTIPVAFCSTDESIQALDRITAIQFLEDHNFKSPYLHWYVSYCCADDYGSSLSETSAWAMIHYFASRKGDAANAGSDAVLTWPEGNFWLANNLKKSVLDNIKTNTLAYNITTSDNNVEVLIFDARENVSKTIIATSVILATPQFINQKLLKNVQRNIDYKQFQYAPWMVANITINNATLNEKKGEQLCWDNVIYGSSGLGYVNALQQNIGFHDNQKVITYYKPLLSNNAAEARMQAFTKTFDQWGDEVLTDLTPAHAELRENISEMNIWIWGHGMIKPVPGFIWGSNRAQAALPIDNKIHFAHSDLSGVSIFEEAFYHGHRSAKAVLGHDKI